VKHKFIVIEGNIGSGKTSLSMMLAEKYQTGILLEKFIDNPFLPKFYQEPERFAFSVEMAFLAERYHQFQKEFVPLRDSGLPVISDYSFYKSLIFAQENLETTEFELFSNLFQIINRQLPQPQLFVYLHNGADQLLQNIKKRNREFELDLSDTYLNKIARGYFRFMNEATGLRYLVIETDNLDFISNSDDFEWINSLIQQDYPYGITRVRKD
jgi:deoxyadenosine/deoxycytidine kinase